jgi:histidine ammonia-lyase
MLAIGKKDLSLFDIHAILFQQKEITISNEAARKVEESYHFLKDFSKGKLIYGINTGFGPMAQYKIDDEKLIQLQYNLIRSHCSGAGNLLAPLYVKAAMIARLSSLLKGYSGVHFEVIQLLIEFINKDINPCIYEHGGVGASGDLVQLAHLALSLIGEGEVTFKGQIKPTNEVLHELNIQPLHIYLREGIALINGTSVMTGIGLINIIYAKKLIHWSIIFSSMINEIVEAFDDHFSEELNAVKMHQGQRRVAQVMREIISGSELIRDRAEHLYLESELKTTVFDKAVQEYYSLRCVPQILGPILETIENAELIVVNELNSVNDNPVIDAENNNVFHGGNFHGEYVSLEMDKLKISITKLAMLSERQLNFLLNDKINKKLPPFINLGQLGFNFGIQGMQFTATSTTAECQTLSMPMSIHSIPNNNDNQDIVSMGTNAALITKKVIENAFEVFSIHGLAIVQAVDYLNCAAKLSPFSAKIYSEIRAICPVIIDDLPSYQTIKNMGEFLKEKENNLI